MYLRIIIFLVSSYSAVQYLCAQGTQGSVPISHNPKRVLVDTIVARVNGVNILLSDLLRPQISHDGAPLLTMQEYTAANDSAFKRARTQRIDEEIQFQKAVERKLLPTELDIEKQIARFKQLHGLTKVNDEELERIIQAEGLTLKRYRYQLKRWLAIEKLHQDELSKRLVVTSQEAEAYYQKHKEKQVARYKLALANVDRATLKKKNPSKSDLLNRKDIEWITLPFVEKDKISRELAFVSSMQVGEVSSPIATAQGYQLVKLLEKTDDRYKTFDEQYITIEKALIEQKRAQFAREYVKELRKKAHITYLT